MSNLCAMSAEELTTFATAIAVELSRGKSPDEIFVLRNIVSTVAQNLFAIASQKQFLEKNCQCKKDGTDRKTENAKSEA